MALVYFDPRWKEEVEHVAPGPGEYETAQDRPKTKQSQSRSRTMLKKTMPVVSSAKEEKPPTLQDCTNHERIHGGMDESFQMRKEALKKGKIYHKNTSAKPRDLAQEELSYNFEVKNGDRSQLLVGVRDKWYNKRIVEMLHQQKEKQNKPRSKLKFSNSVSKSNYLSNNHRQKLQDDLKEIQILYKRQPSRMDSLNNIKFINRQISSKQKERENKSHNYIGTINQKGRSEKSIEDFSVQPAAVYKSLQDDTENSIPRNTVEVHPSYTLYHIKKTLRDKDDSMPTGISDDLLDDSVEYIDDATPGPGSYNLANKSMVKTSGSKVQKFGVTIDRFKTKKGYQAQTYITPIYPDYKASSKARQEAVGFGRTTKDDPEDKKVHSGVFYEDHKTLENISKKTLLKSKSQKVGFQSCKERFDYKQNKQGTLSEEEQPQSQPEQNQTETIPNSVFRSNVQRQIPLTTFTGNVDFTGQNVGCLAYKLIKQQEFYEDYEIDPVSFNTKQTRFKYQQQKKPEQKKEELKLLKIKELKERQEKKLKKAPQGYSFGKEVKKDVRPEKIPSPDKYDCGPEWIKKSYNMRFS